MEHIANFKRRNKIDSRLKTRWPCASSLSDLSFAISFLCYCFFSLFSCPSSVTIFSFFLCCRIAGGFRQVCLVFSYKKREGQSRLRLLPLSLYVHILVVHGIAHLSSNAIHPTSPQNDCLLTGLSQTIFASRLIYIYYCLI